MRTITYLLVAIATPLVAPAVLLLKLKDSLTD